MNLHQLYYFRTVAELEHYTRGSEVLSVSQSSLSHAIAGMEEEIGAPLFAKNGRNVALTQYGKMFLPYVKRSLDALEAGLDELKHAIDPDTGTVTIACFPSLARFVPDIIVRYISETGRVDARIHTSQEATYYELRDQLLAGKVDFVFATEMRDPKIDCVPIGEHRLALLVAEGSPLKKLSDLNGENFVAYSRRSQLRRQEDALFRRMGIHPRITMETDQDVIIHGLVAAGRGAALTPYPLGGAPYNVKILPIDENLFQRRLFLSWNREAYLSPAAARFRDFIVESGLVFDEYMTRQKIK
ncbi:MAG: LysR family transcriptional regulator [Synergistaceae bacterium]|nr:LysR family transcriptional regulator [Synergistaceae bacterium]